MFDGERRNVVVSRPTAIDRTTETSFYRDDGVRVENKTIVSAKRARTEVTVALDGQTLDRWELEDRFGGAKIATHYRGTADGQVEIEKVSPEQFLAQRGEVFARKDPGVVYGPLKLTYSTGYTSAVLLSSGVNERGEPRHMLASFGVHAASPYPGDHWDEAQLAILDADYNKILSLRMPEESEATHLDVRFEDIRGSKPEPMKRVIYTGYMRDDEGRPHFVEAELELSKTTVEKKDPGLWDKIIAGVNKAVGFEQHAQVLRQSGLHATRLRIDGKDVLKIQSTIGAIDDGARFHHLPNSKRLAINYAPPGSPLLSLVNPKTETTRYRFDATLLEDEHSIITKLIPRVLRRGTLSAHYVVGTDGKRKDIESERLTVEGAPLSTKHYTWKFNGEPVAILQRDLVRVRNAKGEVELGFRETITKRG
jgi:hypothetical protein